MNPLTATSKLRVAHIAPSARNGSAPSAPRGPGDTGLQALLERSVDGFLAVDGEWRITYVTGALAGLLGGTRGELAGRDLWRVLPELEGSALSPEIREAMAQRRVVEMEVHLEASDGWARVAVHPEDDGLAFHFHDITGRKHAEVVLRESEARFRTALEHAPIGMALVGLDGRWLMVNRALCGIVGYAREELLGLTFQEITHPEDLAPDLELIRRLWAGTIPWYEMEKRYIRKDGCTVWVHLTASVVRDGDGSPLYAIAQVQDVTARRWMQERGPFMAEAGLGPPPLDDPGADSDRLRQKTCPAAREQDPVRGAVEHDLLGALAAPTEGGVPGPESRERPLRVLVVDDYADYREIVCAFLESRPEFTVAAEVGTGEEAVERARELRPDVVLMDLGMPGMGGVEATRRIVAEGGARVLALTGDVGEETVIGALEAGASGFLSKEAGQDALVPALRAAAHGAVALGCEAKQLLLDGNRNGAPAQSTGITTDLSHHEERILGLSAYGYTSREIGKKLYLSPQTVDTYRARAMRRLGLETRADLVNLALQLGLMRAEE